MHALGTAEYHAPIAPMMKGIETPSMGKDSIGWGAMAGVLSTILAQKGFTGIRPLFEDSPENDRISGLGSRYEIMCLVKRKWIGLFLISGGLAPLKTFEIC